MGHNILFKIFYLNCKLMGWFLHKRRLGEICIMPLNPIRPLPSLVEHSTYPPSTFHFYSVRINYTDSGPLGDSCLGPISIIGHAPR